MSSRVFKDGLYAELAVLGKALANPHRLELLDLLGQGKAINLEGGLRHGRPPVIL